MDNIPNDGIVDTNAFDLDMSKWDDVVIVMNRKSFLETHDTYNPTSNGTNSTAEGFENIDNRL